MSTTNNFWKVSLWVLSAGRAQALEVNLLVVNNKTSVGTFGHRQGHFHQAVSAAAACTGKVRMALTLGTVIG
jgi:hypothetical protein